MGTRRGNTIKFVLKNAYSCVRSGIDEDKEGFYGDSDEECLDSSNSEIEKEAVQSIISKKNVTEMSQEENDHKLEPANIVVLPEINEEIIPVMDCVENQDVGVIINLGDEIDESDEEGDLNSFESDFMEGILEIHNQMRLESLQTGNHFYIDRRIEAPLLSFMALLLVGISFKCEKHHCHAKAVYNLVK